MWVWVWESVMREGGEVEQFCMVVSASTHLSTCCVGPYTNILEVFFRCSQQQLDQLVR